MRFYWPIAKVDGEQRMVWGYASTEAEDDQGETVTRQALEAANHVVASQLWRAIELNAFNMSKQ